MTIEEIQNICKQLPGVTEDIKWEEHLCFNVELKMFMVTTPDSIPISASFRVSEDKFEELIATEGFSPHKNMGRHNWVNLDNINRLTREEWEFYIRQSHQLVASILPTKTQKQLGL